MLIIIKWQIHTAMNPLKDYQCALSSILQAGSYQIDCHPFAWKLIQMDGTFEMHHLGSVVSNSMMFLV